MTDRKLKVFLCHASQDKPIVRELYQRLAAESWIDPWLDEEKLLPGHDWDMEIEKAVETADAVIVCLSNNSVTKEGYVQRELRFALDIALTKPEETIFIIPLRLEECQPPRRLRIWHYADYFPSETREKAYQRLLESLKSRSDKLGIRHVSFMPKYQFTQTEPTEFVYGGLFFVKIISGDFMTGNNEDGKRGHKLLLSYDYWIGSHPITNMEYAKFAKEIGHSFIIPKGKNDHPVTNITWNAAKDFAEWFNSLHKAEFPRGYIIDLPSVEEWEKAARGIDGRIYPWGNEFDKKKCNTRESKIGGTTPIDKYSPMGNSPYGARDMAGNVWEWTCSSLENTPDSLMRIICGGSFADEPIYAKCASRTEYTIATSADSFGFRLAVVPAGKNLRDEEIRFPTL